MGTAAIQRTATVVASPSFVVALANNLGFEVNIVIISCDGVSSLLTARETRAHGFLFTQITDTC
jgi:hypothetical protein